MSTMIILFLIFINFGLKISWEVFINGKEKLYNDNDIVDISKIKYIAQNIEEDGIITNTNNLITQNDKLIINKIKSSIVNDIDKLKTSFNIKENLIIGLDNILNKWNYPKYRHKKSGKYIDTVELEKTLKNLNNLTKLNNKQTDEKRVLNDIEEYKNLYDGVWEKITNNEKNNIIERILIKTYGIRHAIGISLNNSGYVIKKYDLFLKCHK